MITTRSRILLIMITSANLLACDGTSEAPYKSKLDDLNANWNTLDDGSQFALVVDHERDREIAMRCWPQPTSLHLCISVEDVAGVYSRTTVSRSTENTLPYRLWGVPGNGYRCEFVMGIAEEVADGADALITNRLRDTGKPWSRSFVDNYIQANKIKGSRHFRCLEVLRAVLDGSPKSLGTTSVTASMIT